MAISPFQGGGQSGFGGGMASALAGLSRPQVNYAPPKPAAQQKAGAPFAATTAPPPQSGTLPMQSPGQPAPAAPRPTATTAPFTNPHDLPGPTPNPFQSVMNPAPNQIYRDHMASGVNDNYTKPADFAAMNQRSNDLKQQQMDRYRAETAATNAAAAANGSLDKPPAYGEAGYTNDWEFGKGESFFSPENQQALRLAYARPETLDYWANEGGAATYNGVDLTPWKRQPAAAPPPASNPLTHQYVPYTPPTGPLQASYNTFSQEPGTFGDPNRNAFAQMMALLTPQR